MRALHLAVVLGLASPSVVACGGPMSKVRGDNQKFAVTIDSMRVELRAERRKRRDLENQVALLQDRLETVTLQPRSDVTPRLPIEILSPIDVPEGGRLVGTSDDGTEIVYVDEANAPSIVIDSDQLRSDEDRELEPARSRRRSGVAKTPQVDLHNLPNSVDLGTTSASGAIAQPESEPPSGSSDLALDLYRRGTTALRSREHAAAIAVFRDLVSRFPRHEYADNAQYWLGEAFYDQRDYPRAITEFRATVAHYPRGNKVPDALLKIGFSYQALGDATKARAALEQLVSLYPGSSPAAIASARLESM